MIQDLQPDPSTTALRQRRALQITICIAIFLAAIGVRLLYHLDTYVENSRGGTFLSDLIRPYQQDAQKMREKGEILFRSTDRSDARPVLHPPGYSILVLAITSIFDDPRSPLRIMHIMSDGVAAVLVFLIVVQLLPFSVAIISGLLVAVSPHLAYHSLWLSPDSLAVLPILLAVYLILKTSKRPQLIIIIAAGAMVGLSCWLRSNTLLLAPFLSILIFILLERGKRLRYAAIFIAASLIVIAPITIRNWIMYRQFIPLSLGAGITLIEGIADYDKENRFDMPQLDYDVKIKDVEWHNRPEYAGNLWAPDGVKRDQHRFARGLAVIRSNPGWFLKVMLQRAGFMLRYNQSGPQDWPFNSAQVPLVSAEPAFNHLFADTDLMNPVYEVSPEALIITGTTISSNTELSLSDDRKWLKVTGDSSEYGDQFLSAPIAVEKNTDYVLVLPVLLEHGQMAAKVTSDDGRVALASIIIPEPNKRKKRKIKRKAMKGLGTGVEVVNNINLPDVQTDTIQVPFASADRSEVRFVLSNNGSSGTGPAIQAGHHQV